MWSGANRFVLSTVRRTLLPTTTSYLRFASTPIIVKKPPNVKFDPRSKASPFYGLTPIVRNADRSATPVATPIVSEDGETLNTHKEKMDDETETDNDDDMNSDDDDDMDDEAVWFEVSAKIDAKLIEPIPLPERLHVNVLDKQDASLVGTLHLNPIVFGQHEIRIDILKRVVQYQRNKKRGRRKHLTKTIATKSGSGRKVRKQKGGGMARAGHSRPPHWRGGARAHGPKGSVQDYTTQLNKKIRALGMVHALSQKLKERNVIVLNDLMLETHKTKDLASFLLNQCQVGGRLGKSAILCDHVEEESSEVFRNLPIKLSVATGNLSKTKVLHPHYLNVYDLLKYEKLIVTVGGIQSLEKRFKDAAY